MKGISLNHYFLLATPSISEGLFAHSLTYVCEHGDEGAMGIIVNRPLELQLDDILEQLALSDPSHRHHEPVLAGGPLSPERGFVLHHSDSRRWHSTLELGHGLSLTTSRDILDAIAHNEGPGHKLVALGFAGWAPGQLEQELEENVWLTFPADQQTLFETPYHQRADAVLQRLGIQRAQIAPYCGRG